ncbi:MAG: hypothetical protein WDN08_15950 [Rhizomicrobium sp.]
MHAIQAVLLRRVALAAAVSLAAVSPSLAAEAVQATLGNQPILGATNAAVNVNVLSTAAPTGSAATANVISNGQAAAVAVVPYTPTPLTPLAQSLTQLNPTLRPVIDGTTGALATTRAQLTNAAAPVRAPLMPVNPPINALLRPVGLSTIGAGNLSALPVSSVAPLTPTAPGH